MLAKPALGSTLVRKYDEGEDSALKQAMLMHALRPSAVPEASLKRAHGEATSANMRALLIESAKRPAS